MPLPPGIDVAELAPYLGGTLPTADQTFLEFLLAGVIEYAEGRTGRTLTPNPTSGADVSITLPPKLRAKDYWRIPDARSISALVADGITLSADSWVPDYAPVGGTIVWATLARPAKAVTVTGQFGLTTVPAELRDAIYAHTARNYRERDAMYADQIELADGQQAQFFRQVPPRVRLVYDRWTIPPWNKV